MRLRPPAPSGPNDNGNGMQGQDAPATHGQDARATRGNNGNDNDNGASGLPAGRQAWPMASARD